MTIAFCVMSLVAFIQAILALQSNTRRLKVEKQLDEVVALCKTFSSQRDEWIQIAETASNQRDEAIQLAKRANAIH